MRAAPLFALRALVFVAGIAPWALAVARVRTPELVQTFHAFCHQRVERTLFVHGEAMLVCSRCAGVYAGVLVGVLLPLRGAWLARGRALVVGALAVTVVDVIAQDVGLHAPWHAVRIATGLLLGWTASAFMFGTLAQPVTHADDARARTARA